MKLLQSGLTVASIALGVSTAFGALTLTFDSPTINQGGSTMFDVNITNPIEDALSRNVSSFNVQLAFSPDIPAGTTFTSAGKNTTLPYLLDGIGDLSGNDFFSTSNGGSIINFGDVDFDFGFATIDPGETFGLGRLTIDSSALAELGAFDLVFQEGVGLTEVTDDFGTAFVLTTAPGTVNVVPEPGHYSLFIGLIATLGILRWRQRES